VAVDQERTAETEAEDRPRRTWTDAQRAAHRRRQEQRRAPEARPARPSPDDVADEVVGEAVANVKVLAGYLAPFAPHVGAAVAGVRGPDGSTIVESRAEIAGAILLEQARQDARVLRALARFNRLFGSVQLVDVLVGVGAAVAVDAQLVDAHATIKLPGGAEAPILHAVIGDVIQFVDSTRPAAAEPGRVDRNGAGDAEATLRREGQTVIEGGVAET
jgi:hypothetical protein